jgi:hypothetical protein
LEEIFQNFNDEENYIEENYKEEKNFNKEKNKEEKNKEEKNKEIIKIYYNKEKEKIIEFKNISNENFEILIEILYGNDRKINNEIFLLILELELFEIIENFTISNIDIFKNFSINLFENFYFIMKKKKLLNSIIYSNLIQKFNYFFHLNHNLLNNSSNQINFDSKIELLSSYYDFDKSIINFNFLKTSNSFLFNYFDRFFFFFF